MVHDPRFPDITDMSRSALMTAWRTHTPQSLTKPAFRQRLERELMDITPAAVLREVLVTTRGDMGRGARLLHRIPPEPEDVKMSWALLAALDDPWAVLPMATLFSALVDHGCVRLAVAWRRQILNIAVRLDVRRSGAPVLWRRVLDELACYAESRPAPSDPPLSRLQTATRVVVASIGDSESREGKVIASAYKALTAPLPLGGAHVPPDMLCDILDAEFPWLEAATQAVREDLVLRWQAGCPWLRLRPILLLGPPGTGKTRWARRLAQLVGCGFGEVAAGGAADNRSLAGTARGWSSAQPGFALMTMMRAGTANPVIVVDELDKAGTSRHNGHVHDTLLGLLEPETAMSWPDECLLARCDLSQVSWVCTANTLAGLPAPLLSRLRIVATGTPQAAHWPALPERIRRDVAEELGVPQDMLPVLEPEAEAALRQAFSSGAPVRAVKKAMMSALSYGLLPPKTLH